MIESLVDNAIAALLRTISGLKAVAGMSDNTPELTTPFCVVYSNVQGFVGKTPVYELLTTIEYETIPGPDSVASVAAVMSSIDSILNTQPTSAVLAGLPLSGLTYLGWESIQRTQQEPGERRKNVRELKVFAQLS